MVRVGEGGMSTRFHGQDWVRCEYSSLCIHTYKHGRTYDPVCLSRLLAMPNARALIRASFVDLGQLVSVRRREMEGGC